MLHPQQSRARIRPERSSVVKVHVALNPPRFDESVRFYRTFLGLEPVKLKPGYAKFDVAEPGLNLTLNASNRIDSPVAGALNHLGIQVASTEAVKEAAGRLKAEGLATFEEQNRRDSLHARPHRVGGAAVAASLVATTESRRRPGHRPQIAGRGTRALGNGRGGAGEVRGRAERGSAR